MILISVCLLFWEVVCVKKEDIPFLAQSAYDDACRPGNPKETSVEDITKLYESLI